MVNLLRKIFIRDYDNLNDSKIYRTDQNRSIIFKIKNDKLMIEKCMP